MADLYLEELNEESILAAKPVMLQYRPHMKNDSVIWYWVMLPQDRSKALASGFEKTRGRASVAARQAARKNGFLINQVGMLPPLPAS